MISYSRPEYISELKKMWQNIFGDSKRYLDTFFDKVYKAENTLVYLENDNVVSVLYMIPYKFLLEGREKKIVYLYALATKPDFRGRKIMSELIKKSFDISTERGYAYSVLIPAEQALFQYYRQFGYEECFEQVKVIKTFEEIQKEAVGQKPIALIRTNAEVIWNAYSNSEFANSDSIVLSEEQNKFYIDELEAEGGEAFVFKMQGKPIKKLFGNTYTDLVGYALLQLIEDKLVIYESNIDRNNLSSFYAALIKLYIFKTVTFYQPLCFEEKETKDCKKVFAMAKHLNNSNENINLKKPFINRVLM